MPSAYAVARLHDALQRDGNAEWFQAFRQCDADWIGDRPPPVWALRGGSQPVYDVWAAKPRGRMQRPAAVIYGKDRNWYAGCRRDARCRYSVGADNLPAVGRGIAAHLSKAHGLEPR